MANAPARIERPGRREARVSSRLIPVTLIALVAICVAALLLSRHWPFREDAVLQDLRESSDSQISVRSFKATFFPSPGCVLDGVVLVHGGGAAKPLISIDRLIVQADYAELFAHHVKRIVAQGLHISVPPLGTGSAFHSTQSEVKVDEFVANAATLEFASNDSNQRPLVFDIHEASLWGVAATAAFSYRVKLHIPEPPAEISAQGKFGAWNKDNVGETPVSGEYTFENADLSVFDGIAGTLSSKGKFEGKLAHIDVAGDTKTPDFEVKSGKHPMQLKSQFSAYVDAAHGDTFLKRVDADFWNTHVVAAGSIARSADGRGKTALIDLQSNQARIQDLLLMFVTAKQAPMAGEVTFRAHAEIPSGPQPFLRKVKLRADFGVAGGKFSDRNTQQDVDKLSEGARGEKQSSDPETVLTNLKGHEDLTNGVVAFNDITFHIPGVGSRMHGTYNLLNERIDMRGQLRVDTEISNTQTGAKSLLLKAIQPFFKRKKKGQIVPVRLGGTYAHPTFGLDLDDKRAQLRPLHPGDRPK
jgi:AsmA-like C-terminal region